MVTTPDPTVILRLDNVERRVDKLEDSKADVKDVTELRLAMDRNTRMLMALAFTIAGSSVAALITILAVFQH